MIKFRQFSFNSRHFLLEINEKYMLFSPTNTQMMYFDIYTRHWVRQYTQRVYIGIYNSSMYVCIVLSII